MINNGNIATADCVNVVPPADARCLDAAFRIANPDVCPAPPQLIIKPSSVMICTLAGVQFRAVLLADGAETDVTDQSVFTSSNPDVALIGAVSGNATGTGAGDTLVNVSYQALTAQAKLTVLGGDCCDDETVAMLALVDQTKSMSQTFDATYATKLAYARAAATAFIESVNERKDLIGLMRFTAAGDDLMAAPTSDKATVSALVTGIAQTQQSTSYFDALTAAIAELDLVSADKKVIVLFSDGEDETESYTADNNPIQLLEDFKAAGGIVICFGIRAHGSGYALLEAFATGGFFINAYHATAAVSMDYLLGLKGYICAGNCTPVGDVLVNEGALFYGSFVNWDVLSGAVDLQGNGFYDYLPGNGLYVDLVNSGNPNGLLRTKSTFAIAAGKTYRLTVELAGNQVRDQADSVQVQAYWIDGADNPVYLVNQLVALSDYRQGFSPTSFSFVADGAHDIYIAIQQSNTPTGGPEAFAGVLLGMVKLESSTDLITLFFDNFDSENPQYVPPSCGVGTQYVPVSDDVTSVIVSGAGTAGANGQYFINDASEYDKAGGPGIGHYIVPGGGTSAQLFDSDTDELLYGTSSLIGQWDAVNGGDAPAPTVAYVQQYGYAYGYNCYGEGCLTEPPVPQQQDPDPLVDIEAGYTPPRIYTSEKTACATCPADFLNLGLTVVPTMTAATLPSGEASASSEVGATFAAWKAFDGGSNVWTSAFPGAAWLQYRLAAAKIVRAYGITAFKSNGSPEAFELQGSNDGVVWITLDARTGQSWLAGERKLWRFSNETAYLYYRLNIDSVVVTEGDPPAVVRELELFEVPNSPCATVSAESEISQADADQKALSAANEESGAQLNCVPIYTATVSHTSRCTGNCYGPDVTKSATRSSLISLSDAQNEAQTAATEDADAALDCTQSNNAQAITINDSNGSGMAPATPYPSTKFVTGLLGTISDVQVDLFGFTHTNPDDVRILLVSPSGTTLELMRNAGGSISVSGLDLHLQGGAPAIPDAGPVTAGVHGPSNYGVQSSYPSPAPASPYSVLMNAFNGEDPNGCWALYVVDDSALDSGVISGGWDLTLTLTPPPVPEFAAPSEDIL